MAIRKNHPIPRKDNTSTISGERGKPVFQDEDDKVVTRTGAGPSDSDFDIKNFDLSQQDWQVSDEKSDTFDGSYPNIGGTSVVGVFVESQDDNAFSVELQFKDSNGDTLASIDNNVDANLSSSSPTGGNHHVYAEIAVAGDIFDLVITDTSGAAQNNIDGTINAH